MFWGCFGRSVVIGVGRVWAVFNMNTNYISEGLDGGGGLKIANHQIFGHLIA